MDLRVYDTIEQMAEGAAERTAKELARCINEKGHASLMLSTGASQIAYLKALVKRTDVEWGKTTMFHLDEYVGLAQTHPSSFYRYLRERISDIVHPKEIVFINGMAPDPEAECERMAALLPKDGIDVNLVGIGENAHIAFNDPPADFETKEMFFIATLAEAARRQQLGEGWFPTLDDVPRRAISITVPGIMKSKCIISVVPDARKALAVKRALTAPISPDCPATILRKHPNAHLFVDAPAAALLDDGILEQYRT
jgi:glucosamine-6-phosphate deaminase